MRVLLVEQGDLAQATSSASTKLVHGGLRYLEYYEFKLVRESLHERERLLKIAPHIIWPLTFVLPHRDTIRPYWMIRCGLFLYDFLAGKKSLPSCQGLTLSGTPYGLPLQGGGERGFTYADCWVDDARLVALNAQSAVQKGATVLTRTRCSGLRPTGDQWAVSLTDARGTTEITARTVINAAGPWVRQVLDDQTLSDTETPAIRLVQGSHLIVPRLYTGDHAYILQQPDGRIVFTIPYEGKFTLIGTTETAYRGDPLKAQITAQEIDYLLSAVNGTFKKEIQLSDVVRTYSGVRPLFDDAHKDAKAVTRDYRLHESLHGTGEAWMLSVFGGKLTTYRKLAEQVTDRVAEVLENQQPHWTAGEPLPGGDLGMTLPDFIEAKHAQWPAVDPALINRYARSYGTALDQILQAEPGADYGEGVCTAELTYLIQHEFARTAEDVLWRRSKLGIHLSAQTIENIKAAMPNLVQEVTGHEAPRD